MPSAFSGIYLASNALRSFEMALNVTGHNLANVATRGYSRQTIDIQTTPDQTIFGLTRPFKVGTGAYANSVNRVRDIFLQGRFLQNNFENSRLDQMFSSIRATESAFGEPGTNTISTSMAAMFDSWGQLNANPSDAAARLNVRLQSDLFAGRVRDVNAQLLGQRQQLNREAASVITEINNLAQRISEMNEAIRRETAVGSSPNDLLDKRDVLLEDLSDLVNVSTISLRDGSLIVYVDNHALVNQITYEPLPTTYDTATSTVTDGTKVTKINGGRLAGLFGGINAIDTYKSQLDALVNEVRTQINTLHATGTNPNGTTNINFFSGTLGAGDIALDPAILADINNIAASVSGLPGDGSLARAIAAIRDTSLAALGGQSPMEYYTSLISQIGQDGRYYANAAETQTAVLTQLKEQQAAVSGVNSDEELANMLRYQRSFQAAAKILSVLDQTTEELIKSFGR